MRILQLGKYWQKNGGIETHVKTLCSGLADEGFDVVNLVSSTNNQYSRFQHNGFTVVESSSLGTYFNTSFAPQMILKARQLQAEKSFDIIHLHFPDPMSHLASMALPSKIPRIITWHSDIIKQRHLLKFYRSFLLREIQKSKAIVAATASHFKSSSQIPREYPTDQRHVIPFGIDFDWLTPSPEVLKKVQPIKNLSGGRFLVFALGRHVEYKGFGVLIDAMSKTQAFLILAGEGPLTASLKAQVQRLQLNDRVLFTGRLSNIEIAAHYHACDAFCLPSITPNEAFGIVQVEAMACGKPVICTKLDNGVNEINPHGITGLTAQVNNPVSLANAINQLISDSALRHQLGNHAKKYAFSKFDVKKMIKEHIKLYEQSIHKD
jgi:glycosyltransferase involved in cell wall biosynthesis